MGDQSPMQTPGLPWLPRNKELVHSAFFRSDRTPRERGADVSSFVAKNLTARVAGITDGETATVADGADPWPGNIRELRNVIERAIVVCDSPKLSVRDLPAEIAGRHGPETSFTVRLGSSGYEVERELLVRTVAYVKGNKARAANILGMSRGTLYNRLKRYGLPETNGHVNGRSYRNGRNGLS